MRLICFPCADSNAAIYRGLQEYLPDIKVNAAELPGRGTRLAELAYPDIHLQIEHLLDELRQCFEQPFALLGHSLGAVITFELACRLSQSHRSNLCHLFLCAHPAPSHRQHRPQLHGLHDRAFLQGLHKLSGAPKEVLDNSELMVLIMPTLRADFTLIENHQPPTNRTPPIVITAFAGNQDRDIPIASIAGWAQASRSRFDLHVIDGAHFFLKQAMPFMAKIIAARLAANQPFRPEQSSLEPSSVSANAARAKMSENFL